MPRPFNAIGLPRRAIATPSPRFHRCAATAPHAVAIPVIGDADTGYGTALNVRRTVEGYAGAGFACAMIEDQLAPKRCGHTRGKEVVSRADAFSRIRAAIDAREGGADILIMARTDARFPEGLEEAVTRAKAFADLGADIVFVEAPRTESEMARICEEIQIPLLANMVEGGDTPVLPPARLEELGFKIVAYPLTLLNVATQAMNEALAALAEGAKPEGLLSFEALREMIGFDAYDEALAGYRDEDGD